jgi:hypothetical protein
MSSLAARVLGGAVAGLVATAAMSAHMLGEPSRREIGTPPPRRIADALLPREEEPTRRAAAVLLHLAIGAGAGSVYAARRRRHGAVGGAAFGLVVWAFGYQLAVPLLGVLPPAHRDESERRRALMRAHLIYGAVLGLLAPGPRRHGAGR